MPQNSFYTNGLAHPFVQHRDVNASEPGYQDFGGHHQFNGGIGGLKRKQNWIEDKAGNFEMQITPLGPTAQKQVRMTEQTDACLNKPETKQAEEASLAENQVQLCQSISMVAHMTPSFYASENQLSNANGFASSRKPADMEIDCSMQTDEEDQAIATEKMPACHNDYSWYGGSCLGRNNDSTSNWWEDIIGCCHGS
ncbi:uncharacterized protein LOC135681067 isoform X2 [Rhopilema esculentum]|uniref:uncharacterized protein LOC135681067 isoform X2 n=1 Tax=Rhopilema esculentum TaxID=499914 RepID=UPI0031DDB88F|eukprot:gene13123-3913_t